MCATNQKKKKKRKDQYIITLISERVRQPQSPSYSLTYAENKARNPAQLFSAIWSPHLKLRAQAVACTKIYPDSKTYLPKMFPADTSRKPSLPDWWTVSAEGNLESMEEETA